MDTSEHPYAMPYAPATIEWDIRCPKCSYCLRGLPSRSRCPECGFAFVAERPNEELALAEFAKHIPAIYRLGISPRLATRHPIVPFVAAILSAAASAAFFVSIFCLATWIGFKFATPEYPPRRIAVADFGIYGSYGGLLRWYHDGIWHFATFVFFGHLMLGSGIWGLYTSRCKSLRSHGRTLYRLGFFAACSPRPLLTVPFLVVSLWQIPNILVSKSLPTMIEIPVISCTYYNHLYYSRLYCDPLQIVGATLLLFACVWVAIRIIKRHGACSRAVRQALLGVRVDDDAPM